MEKIDMIMFDLDGTLWEVSHITYVTANEILKKHGIDYEITQDVVNSCMGLSIEDCATNYMPFLEKEKRDKIMDEMCKVNSAKILEIGGNLFNNVSNVIRTLSKDYKLAVVSNCSEDEYIKAFFKTGKVEDCFIDFMAASKHKITKGEAIKEVARRNNSQNILYVGDTIKDQEASDAAGATFVYAKYGFGKNVDSKYEINDIAELPELLKN